MKTGRRKKKNLFAFFQAGGYETVQVDRIYVLRRFCQPVLFHIHLPVFFRGLCSKSELDVLYKPMMGLGDFVYVGISGTYLKFDREKRSWLAAAMNSLVFAKSTVRWFANKN